MDTNDENSIDEFAFDLLRRAKERSQVISEKLRNTEPHSEQTIDKMMEKLEKRTSGASNTSPEHEPTFQLPSSPAKSAKRPILKPVTLNGEVTGAISEERTAKKTVTTFDAITGDTIVEAKTFEDEFDEGDDEGSDGGGDNYQNEDDDDNIDKLPKDEELDRDQEGQDDEEGGCETPKVGTTPQLSRTLQKLAEFHSKEAIDSPVHPHTALEAFTENNDSPLPERVSATRKARSSRLSALAQTINQWEDDTTHRSMPGSRFSEVSSANNRASLSGKSRFSAASSPSASSPLSFGMKQGQIQGELQGFTRKQGSPMKQFRDRTPDPKSFEEKDEEMQVDDAAAERASPKKTYFGGSPSRGSPSKIPAPPPPPSDSPVKTPTRFPLSPGRAISPAKSPMVKAGSGCSTPTRADSPIKNLQRPSYFSPSRANSPAGGSPTKQTDSNNFRRSGSVSPSKSPVKNGFISSPLRSGKELTPTTKPAVSAIRMKFEGAAQTHNPAPPKPERAHLKPAPSRFVTGSGSIAKSPLRRSQFGESKSTLPDPSTLSVAERKKLFESSNFCFAQKPAIVEVQAKKPPAVFTSSPCLDGVKPHEIDISSVASIPTEAASKAKRPAPAPPVPESSKSLSPVKRPAPQPSVTSSPIVSDCPPPAPPLPPTTSTPTSVSNKRRSTSPMRTSKAEEHSVKRIKVNAPKPGRIYPSLTDIETETETEAEGHYSEDEPMEDDSMESQQSLGAAIETIAKACSPIRPAPGSRLPARYRPSEDFSATFACAQVDALIDEALEGQDYTMGTIDCSTVLEVDKTCTPNSQLKHSASQSQSPPSEQTVLNAAADLSSSSSRSPSPEAREGEGGQLEASYSEADTTASSSFAASPVMKSLVSNSCNSVAAPGIPNQSNEVENENKLAQSPVEQKEEPAPTVAEDVPRTLVHTVSFYRRQQQSKKSEANGGLNDISEHPEYNEDSAEEVTVEKPDISAMIKKFEEEVERCNLSIAQASKALNWCKALVGFSDSTEYIECERILLIETQKRLALLNSIHRLKTDGALSQQMPNVFSPSKQEVTPSCKGNMRISDVSVTLRRDFFSAHRAECQYHFICLVRNKHQIEHTTLLTYESQKQGSSLKFPNEFNLLNLDPDFQVHLEVYYLESAKEFLPHEAKYRINAKKDNKQATLLLSPLLTPSKKGGKGDHYKPQVHSPAGPDAVKSSSFKYCGGLSVDISSLQRTYWELDKASGPLTGGINLKVQCSAMGGFEHKGFLTLFEDVSGYGAWVRRWCRLGPAVLEFWKYPEDETECRKPPLGTLNLHECVTSKVRPAPRDVCARANTLLLVTTRAPHPNDKNTLVTSCHKGYTAVRHLISADTREERDVWCQRLNKALANLRAWDPVAKQSVDDSLF